MEDRFHGSILIPFALERQGSISREIPPRRPSIKTSAEFSGLTSSSSKGIRNILDVVVVVVVVVVLGARSFAIHRGNSSLLWRISDSVRQQVPRSMAGRFRSTGTPRLDSTRLESSRVESSQARPDSAHRDTARRSRVLSGSAGRSARS